ncbi:hypothetical protein CFE70_004635 [Pyrenophora teres f. teres 0-1]
MTSRFPTAAEFAAFPPPNYVDPVTKFPLALAIVIPMTVIVVGFISCRFYCRTVLIRTLGWDDWSMLMAAVSGAGKPASTYWEVFKYFHTAKCLNIKAIYYFHGSQNTLSDFLIFLWPAKNLLSVQVSLRQRLTLTSMFSLGVIVCIAGIVRMYYTYLYLESFDAYWYGASTFIIMSVESGVGVACGCLPGCKPLMNKLMPRVFGNTSQASRRRPSGPFGAPKGMPSSSSAGMSTHASYRMQPIRQVVAGAALSPEKRGRDMDVEKQLPTTPLPSHQSIRVPSRSAFPARREAYRELAGNRSDSSIEIFLLYHD